jgi:hypothetical protein
VRGPPHKRALQGGARAHAPLLARLVLLAVLGFLPASLLLRLQHLLPQPLDPLTLATRLHHRPRAARRPSPMRPRHAALPLARASGCHAVRPRQVARERRHGAVHLRAAAGFAAAALVIRAVARAVPIRHVQRIVVRALVPPAHVRAAAVRRRTVLRVQAHGVAAACGLAAPATRALLRGQWGGARARRRLAGKARVRRAVRGMRRQGCMRADARARAIVPPVAASRGRAVLMDGGQRGGARNACGRDPAIAAEPPVTARPRPPGRAVARISAAAGLQRRRVRLPEPGSAGRPPGSSSGVCRRYQGRRAGSKRAAAVRRRGREAQRLAGARVPAAARRFACVRGRGEATCATASLPTPLTAAGVQRRGG